MSELIHELLERNARKYPSQTAIRFPEQDLTITWPELNRQANSLARHLRGLGIGPAGVGAAGKKVAILIPNRPEFVVAYFAILKAGGVAVPVNVKLTPAEISYILQDSESRVLVFDESLRSVAEPACREAQVRFAVSTADLPEINAREPEEDQPSGLGIFDPAEILYTSGTTGKPKGVVLSHHAAFSVGSMFAYETQIRQGDRVLTLMPLTHSAPLNLFLVAAAYAGAGHIIGTYLPPVLPQLVQAEKATHFFGAPVAYLLTGKMPNLGDFDLSSVKYWLYGGAPMSREAVHFAQAKFGGRFMSLYGLTESGPNGIALYPEEHAEHAGSIGWRGVVNVETRLVDAGGRDVVPASAGGVGEIVMRGPSMMLGYYKNDEATREVIRDGWLWTGDMARVDEQGYLWVMDRKKDMIISGGVNVYPKEVEDVLGQHPDVVDVAVLGRPHPEWGETVLAVIVPKPEKNPTLHDLQAFCRQRLADFKHPRLMEVVPVIPRNASGKILKKDLRERFGGGR